MMVEYDQYEDEMRAEMMAEYRSEMHNEYGEY